MDLPLALDLDFNFDFPSPSTDDNLDLGPDTEGIELRSPRSPISSGDSPHSSSPSSPFDPSRFFRFPLDPPSKEASPVSSLHPLTSTSHVDLLHPRKSFKDKPSLIASPPPQPLSWIWICHLCHSRYLLGATRRCLVDGHWYCSGVNANTVQRNVKRKKKGQACSSEFDYVGWQTWLHWRQDALAQKQKSLLGASRGRMNSVLKGCENCEYPSQCRYEKLDKIPDVVPTTSKKTRAKKAGVDPMGQIAEENETAFETDGDDSSQQSSSGRAKVDTTHEKGTPNSTDAHTADMKTGTRTKTKQQDNGKKWSEEAAASSNLQSMNLPQLKRTKSKSGRQMKEKFEHKQSQIFDFFRVSSAP